MSPPIHFYTALSRSIVNIRSPAFSLCRPATRSEHNWSKPVRKPKPWIKPLPLPPGCDFKHWLVVMENPVHEKTRPEMIEYFVKTLAQVVGSEEAAKEKIYSISHKHYIAFGVRLSESFTHNLKELPDVRWVLPDSYMSGSKNYGGEPFVKGQALPYEKSFHKAWLDRKAWVQKMQDMEYEEEHQKCWEYKLEMEKEKKKNKKKGRPRANIGGMDQKGMRGPPHGGGMQHHLNNGEAATYGEDGDNDVDSEVAAHGEESDNEVGSGFSDHKLAQ